MRSTELGKIEEIADELRAQNGQASFATLASSMAVNSVLIDRRSGRLDEPARARALQLHDGRRLRLGALRMRSAAAGRRIERIQTDEQGGMVIYMSGHEGRGIGLWAKAATYLLQDAGEDTYEANRSLGLPDDSRDFSDAGRLLKFFLKTAPFRLLTNNPKKVDDLSEMGLHENHARETRDRCRRQQSSLPERRSRIGGTS